MFTAGEKLYCARKIFTAREKNSDSAREMNGPVSEIIVLKKTEVKSETGRNVSDWRRTFNFFSM